MLSGKDAEAAPRPFEVAERLDVVDSTNRYLVDLAGKGLADGDEVPAGYAVVAERQTHGRGRLGRRWEAPAGSAVLCSILLRPEGSAGELHLAAWAVALGAAQACAVTAGIEPSLKWPNDLVVGAGGDQREVVPGGARLERKVAGILSEVLPAPRPSVSGSRQNPGVVVGIGINVNWPDDWPPEDSDDPDLVSIKARATALNRVARRPVDREALVGLLLRNTGTWNAMLATQTGRRALASEYRRRSATIGREVRVQLEDESVSGTALDVDDAGCLLVSVGACIRTLAAGDVVHVR